MKLSENTTLKLGGKILNICLVRIARIPKIIGGILSLLKLLYKYRSRKVIISVLGGIGDNCVAATCLGDYIRPLENNYVVISTEYSAGVLKSFGIENVVIISKRQMDQIWVAGDHSQVCRDLISLFTYMERLCFVNPWRCMGARTHYIPAVSMIDVVGYGIYGLKDIHIRLPLREYNCEAVLQKFGIEEEFVLFNNKSFSLDIDDEVFEKAANILQLKGIRCYSNCTKGGEPVPGTQRIECSLDEFASLAHAAKAVISIRSGLLDWVIGDAKKIVALYGDDRSGFRYIYSLKMWKQETELLELVDYDIDEAISKIEEFVFS